MRGQGRTPRYAMKRNALLVTSHANARCSTAAGTVPHSQQSQPGRPCQAALQASAIPPQPLPLQPRFNNNALPLHPALSNVAAKPFVPYSQGTSRWHPPLQSGGVPVYYSQSDNTHPPLAMPLTSFGDKASAHEPLVTTGGLPPLVPSRPSFQLQPNNHARVAAAPPDVRRGLQAHSAGANPPLAPARSSAQPPFCPAATAQPVPFGSYTQSAPKSVAERVVKFLHYGREKAVAALRCSQKLESDGGCKGDASRGPGNRPRGIWSLPEVQEMQIEILGKAGLDIVDNTGALQINPATHMPFKNLPKKYATEARDLLETLLLDYHSGCVEVEKAIGNAKAELREAGHFLSVEAVRQHTVGLLDRLLEHLDSLRQVRHSRQHQIYSTCMLV